MNILNSSFRPNLRDLANATPPQLEDWANKLHVEVPWYFACDQASTERLRSSCVRAVYNRVHIMGS